MSFTFPANFTELLNSQQIFLEDESFEQVSKLTSSQSEPKQRKERISWTPADDVVLISAWLNTSKDPLVGNEQKSGAFWKRVAAYFAASIKEKSADVREPSHCKQRWYKINDMVSKFCGAYEAASREKSSGQNETDIMKRAHEIYFTNHQKKFGLEHAWLELRHDQKWCQLSTTKAAASSKRSRNEEGSESVDEISVNRPAGVKAAKGKGKKKKTDDSNLSMFQAMWEIKEKDNTIKERLQKMSLLHTLIGKTEPLSAGEEALKQQLLAELVG